MAGIEITQFDADSYRRLAATVHRLEAQVFNLRRQLRRAYRGEVRQPLIYQLELTSDLAAASGSTVGEATAKELRRTGTTIGQYAPAGATRPRTIHNAGDSGFTAGTRLAAVQDIFGTFWPAAGGAAVVGSGVTYLQASANKAPGSTDSAAKMLVWNGSAWVQDGSKTGALKDPDYRACLLAGERCWAAYDKDDGAYFPICEVGLNRKASLDANLAVGSAGNCTLYQHSGGTCAGAASNLTVAACNGDAATTGTRYLLQDEIVYVQFLELKWHITQILRPTLVGKPTSNLQSGSAGTFNIYRLVSGTWTQVSGASVSARNTSGVEYKSTRLYEIIWTGRSDTPFALPIEGKPCE